MADGRIVRIVAVLGLVGVLGLAGCAGLGKGTPGEAVAPTRAVSVLELPTGKTSRFLGEKHFVTYWLVLGPFQFGATDFGGDQQQDAADNEFVPAEGRLDGTQAAPEGTSWKEKHFKGDLQAGRVDLDAFYGVVDHAAAYAVCWLQCPEEVPGARLLVGSDDYIKVWLNGALVHSYKDRRRASGVDQDKVEGLALHKGHNRVVVKCVDVVYDWDFYLRLTDKDGKPIAARPSVAAEK